MKLIEAEARPSGEQRVLVKAVGVLGADRQQELPSAEVVASVTTKWSRIVEGEGSRYVLESV